MKNGKDFKKVIPDFESSMIKKIELNNESGKVVLEKRRIISGISPNR